MNTIIYLTDNTLDETLAEACRKHLSNAAREIPIVSVSQKPLSFGENICVGELGRSWMSLYAQLLAGLEATKTEAVVVAEHDCLYSPEHLSWTPPRADTFYYNHHHYLVQWGGNHPELNGMYSFWPGRNALSQMICAKSLALESTEEVMGLLKMGLQTKHGLRWHGEFGTANTDFLKAALAASSGYPVQLQRYLKAYTTKYRSEAFETKVPNLDIRHGSNFTGPKRGGKRTYELPYWGKFDRWLS